MTSNIVLYRADGACSLIPHILLNELEIQFSEVLMKFGPDGFRAANDSFSNADYRRTTPSGLLPALQVDGEVITELLAVLSYISDLVPKRNMLGATHMERAQAYSWLAWLCSTLHGMGFAMMWRPKRFTDSDDEQIQDSIKQKGWSGRIGIDVKVMKDKYPRFCNLATELEKMDSVRKVLLAEKSELLFSNDHGLWNTQIREDR